MGGTSGAPRLVLEPRGTNVRQQVDAVGAKARKEVEVSGQVRRHADQYEVSLERAERRPPEHVPPSGEERQSGEVAQPAGHRNDRGAPGSRAPLETPTTGKDVTVPDRVGVLIQESDGAQERQERNVHAAAAHLPVPQR